MAFHIAESLIAEFAYSSRRNNLVSPYLLQRGVLAPISWPNRPWTGRGRHTHQVRDAIMLAGAARP